MKTIAELQFEKNHENARQYEDEILDMLKENNYIRETVICLSEEIFINQRIGKI